MYKIETGLRVNLVLSIPELAIYLSGVSVVCNSGLEWPRPLTDESCHDACRADAPQLPREWPFLILLPKREDRVNLLEERLNICTS